MDHLFPQSRSSEPEDLTRNEWVVIIFLIISLLVVVMADKPSAVPSVEYSSDPLVYHREVMVEVSGAVARPGIYHFPKGVTLKEILDCAEPLPNAVVDGRSLRKKYKSASRVIVESTES